MSSDPRECREQARECARIAMSSSDPRDGADYAALAYTWLKLAEIFEHDNAMLARWDKDFKSRAAEFEGGLCRSDTLKSSGAAEAGVALRRKSMQNRFICWVRTRA